MISFFQNEFFKLFSYSTKTISNGLELDVRIESTGKMVQSMIFNSKVLYEGHVKRCMLNKRDDTNEKIIEGFLLTNSLVEFKSVPTSTYR